MTSESGTDPDTMHRPGGSGRHLARDHVTDHFMSTNDGESGILLISDANGTLTWIVGGKAKPAYRGRGAIVQLLCMP